MSIRVENVMYVRVTTVTVSNTKHIESIKRNLFTDAILSCPLRVSFSKIVVDLVALVSVKHTSSIITLLINCNNVYIFNDIFISNCTL